ncbi:MAG: anaerobic glycerol-3-phosphate dehydrogenase subunit GlpB [Solirubrobacteraceae bacterium]
MKPSLHFDVVVIGAGVAGLTAATRLAQSGASVCVMAKGMGSTHLAPGLVDVLGYDPERVSSPAESLPSFVEARPDHPYATIGLDGIGAALEWFGGIVDAGPHPSYRYVGELGRNHILPTALGAKRPSALVPETFAQGELVARRGSSSGPICVVGIRVLRDFHASLCAANLERDGVAARGVQLEVDVGRAEANSLGLARRMDDHKFRAAFAAQLLPLLRADERVGLPAIIGLRDPHGAWSELESRLGRAVFEIPTLPPSASGIRVYDALRSALRAAGGRLVMGARVVEAERDGDRVTAVRAHTSGHDHVYGARWVVVATGGFTSGAIELGSDWQARETALGLQLRGLPGDGEPRYSGDYFADQPMSRVGIAVDSSLLADGTSNVMVAGAALPGAEPWREGSGDGIALSSGLFAARTVLECEGAAAAA